MIDDDPSKYAVSHSDLMKDGLRSRIIRCDIKHVGFDMDIMKDMMTDHVDDLGDQTHT